VRTGVPIAPRMAFVQSSGGDELRRQLETAARDLDASSKCLVADLRQAGALTESEAAAARFTIEIVDRRYDRSQPLPAVAELLPPAR